MGSRKLWLWPLYPPQGASGGNIQREVDSKDGQVVSVEIEREPMANLKTSVVEYALHDTRKPIGVATDRTVKRLPRELKGQLPNPEEIAKLLEDQP